MLNQENNLPHIISLPKIEDDRGNLSFFENHNHIPFEIKRENFSTNSLALVVSSTEYEEADYIRDFDQYLKFKQV